MPALFAYLAALLVVPVFLAIDWLTRGYLVDLLYSPVPFVRAASWVPATIFYIVLIYIIVWVAAEFVLRGSRELDATGQRPRRADSLLAFDQQLRWDYGLWPVLLAIIAGVLALITLPALHFHLVSPVAWTLTMLLAPTLIGLYIVRETPPPLQEPTETTITPPVIELPPPPAEIVERLKLDARYRGQLRAFRQQPARAAAALDRLQPRPWHESMQPGGLLNSALHELGVAGLAGLYTHQHEALDRLLSDPDGAGRQPHVVLATGPGSGRHVTLFLAMLDRTLRRGAHVLVITPDDESLTREYNYFRELADRTDWHYALHEARISTAEQRAIPDPPPEILYCSLDALHRGILRDRAQWAEFFDGIELVIVHDIDCYVGILGANTAAVFRRLRQAIGSDRRDVQFVATTSPAGNLESFATALFGLSPERDVVQRFDVDGAPRPEKTLGVWSPALDRQGLIIHAGREVERVRRQAKADAAVELAAMLSSIPHYRTLIHCYDWGADETEQLRNAVFRAAGTPLPERRLRITAGETELSETLDEYDGLLVLGAPWHAAELERLSGRLGRRRRGGLALAVESPSAASIQLTQALLQLNPTQHSAYGPPTLTLDTRNPHVVEKHLACAAIEAPLTRSAIALAFGRAGAELADQWAALGRIRWEELPGVTEDRSLVIADQDWFDVDRVYDACRLDTIEADGLIPITTIDGRPVAWIDGHRVAAAMYPGRVLVTAAQPMELVAGMDGLIAESVVGGVKQIVVPLHNYTADAAEEPLSPPPPTQLHGGAPLAIARRTLWVTQTLRATKNTPTSSRSDVLIAPAARPATSRYPADALLVSSAAGAPEPTLTGAQAIAGALQIALRARLARRLDETEYAVAVLPVLEGYATGPALAVFDAGAFGLGLAAGFQSHVPELLADAYRVLLACPCRAGCPVCIDARDAGGAGSQIDKRAALRYLGEVLGSTAQITAGDRTPEQIDTMRYHAVSDINDLINVQQQVLELGLEPLLGAKPGRVHTWAAVRFMTQAEADDEASDALVGFYNASLREVAVRPQVEELLVGVVAHEYAHDWLYQRDDTGRPNVHPSIMDPAIVAYGGMLLVEGFAQWIELRVLDAYGFKRDVDEITFRYFDAYGEGFQIIKHIEDSEGVAGVLKRMRSPITVAEVQQLMDRTNTRSRVISKVRQLEGGELKLPPPDVVSPPPPEHGEPAQAEEAEYAGPDGASPNGATESQEAIRTDASEPAGADATTTGAPGEQTTSEPSEPDRKAPT